MIGPPGAGKSMMARSLPSILPRLTLKESIDITKIYSVKGLLKEGEPLITRRPFRAPHHTVSQFALTGGGRNPVPGEMSLAHNGVLFLDELPEFKRDAIEVMRQPLEEGQVTISRVYAAYTFPADFMLVAAMNPCPCGYYPDRRRCQCSPAQIHRYLAKVSQPMLDRIDLCVETRAVLFEQLREHGKAESSASIRARVMTAHQRQKQRYQGENIVFNSQLCVRQIATYCALKPAEEAVMMDAVSQYQLSTRAYHRILKVARTIADLADSEEIQEEHLLEALAYHNSNLSDWNTCG
jgi:magnesium chelatase family protein